jgi:hypothetical protein
MRHDCSPGSHPHSDRPNWRPAETIDEYVANCRDGLEQYSDRHAAKLLGVPRVHVYRMRLAAEISDDLFERLLEKPSRPPGLKQLAAVALALRSGELIRDAERCSHCGGVVRVRARISSEMVEIVNAWLAEQGGAP